MSVRNSSYGFRVRNPIWPRICRLLGDPAADLASIAVTVGWDAAAEIAPDLVPAARAYAGTFALQQALPAFHARDEENLTDGLIRYRG